MPVYSIEKLTDEARRLALEYREATGKTLPITAEIAVNDAVRLLHLIRNETREGSYDATLNLDGKKLRVQIKGRAIFKPGSGYRLGQFKLEQNWDAMMLVIMNDRFETDEIYLCHRNDIENYMKESSSNKRGAISVARFRNTGTLLWSRENGREDDGYWSNDD